MMTNINDSHLMGKHVCQGVPSVSTEPIDLESLTEGKWKLYKENQINLNVLEFESILFSFTYMYI